MSGWLRWLTSVSRRRSGNWAGRFIANGIDYNDFVRTTGAVSRWEQWLDAWTATAEVHVELARRRALEQGHRHSAGEAFVRAAVSYHFSKFVWVLDPALNRRNTEAAVSAPGQAHELLDPTAERIEAPLRRRRGRRQPAPPARPLAPRRPLVVLIPGLDSTKEEFFPWEDVFLHRGMATLSLDGPGQRETGFRAEHPARLRGRRGGDPRRRVGATGADPHRIGAVGVSLGGHYVVRAAAFEPRLKAIAGISGPFEFAANWDLMPELTRETFAHHTGSPPSSRRGAAPASSTWPVSPSASPSPAW